MADWTHCPYCGAKVDPTDTSCRNCAAATPSATTVRSGETEIGEDPAELEALTVELEDALVPNLQLLRQLGQGGLQKGLDLIPKKRAQECSSDQSGQQGNQANTSPTRRTVSGLT